MDEGTPLLAVLEEWKSAKRARAGTYLIIFLASICFIHLGLDYDLPISSASGQDALRHASHSGSTSKVSPPCCHSGSQEGRRATEAIHDGLPAGPCILCPSSSSGAGSSSSSSMAAASSLFSVNPCLDGQRLQLKASKGQLGTQPPQMANPRPPGTDMSPRRSAAASGAPMMSAPTSWRRPR
jgi:hypothetical protein